jgi:hypothetical protein
VRSGPKRPATLTPTPTNSGGPRTARPGAADSPNEGALRLRVRRPAQAGRVPRQQGGQGRPRARPALRALTVPPRSGGTGPARESRPARSPT